jgi:Fic family protein
LAHVVSAVWPGAGGVGVPRARRDGCRYEAYVPDRLSEVDVVLPPDVAADVSDAELAIARLNETGPVVASLESLARLLLRAESVASSRIEGLEVGGRRLLRAEAARASGELTHDVTAEAVLGNVEAMALAVGDLAARPRLTLDDVLAVHRALMKHTDHPEFGGEVRTSQNWIGGSDYNPCGAAFVPPPPEHVPALLDDLVQFVSSDRYPPLVQAALAHVQFETIHPFGDGNGRVGRALIHVVLRRRGLAPRYVPPISLILATRHRDYIRGLSAARYSGSPDGKEAQQGYAEWIAVFAAAAGRAAADARLFGGRIDALVEHWRLLVGSVRARSAADRLLRSLPSAPVVTVATAAAMISRSFQATNEAIERLTDAGVLRQTKLGRRNRAFEAVGLVDEITRFERMLASPAGDTREATPVRRVPYRAPGARRRGAPTPS